MKLILLLVVVGVVYVNLADGAPSKACVKKGSICTKKGEGWYRGCCKGLKCVKGKHLSRCRKQARNCVAISKSCGGGRKKQCCNDYVCYEGKCRHVVMMPVIKAPSHPYQSQRCLPFRHHCRKNGKRCCSGKCYKNKCVRT